VYHIEFCLVEIKPRSLHCASDAFTGSERERKGVARFGRDDSSCMR
jgi:hypothetical protein